ncbi:MAG: hypothetical protein JW996_07345 [Candidatus Cloacimonetes bacterium]|nr:hypothetical protein [Candidatus Cloacimonadota bacterium]
MKSQISFSNLGNQFIHEMREGINNSEDKVDLENCFSMTVAKFLKRVFEDHEIRINDDDIRFDPAADNYFSLHGELRDHDYFKEIWHSSDLPNVIKKFANSVYHRYLHLDRHPEKTQKKIRN